MLKQRLRLVDHLRNGHTWGMKNCIDISPTLSTDTAVFPGDQAFELTNLLSYESGDHIALSYLKSTVHLGSHADAPSHYGKGEANIAAVDLSYYMGLAQVVEVKAEAGARLYPSDLKSDVQAPRVLFKTGSYPNSDQWTPTFNSLSPELVNFLAEKNVRLVGIDTPSIDPADAKELITHLAVLKNKMAILEGLILKDVPEGLYILIALPLKLQDAEASPVRAVLLPTETDLSRL